MYNKILELELKIKIIEAKLKTIELKNKYDKVMVETATFNSIIVL